MNLMITVRCSLLSDSSQHGILKFPTITTIFSCVYSSYTRKEYKTFTAFTGGIQIITRIIILKDKEHLHIKQSIIAKYRQHNFNYFRENVTCSKEYTTTQHFINSYNLTVFQKHRNQGKVHCCLQFNVTMFRTSSQCQIRNLLEQHKGYQYSY